MNPNFNTQVPNFPKAQKIIIESPNVIIISRNPVNCFITTQNSNKVQGC